MRFKEFRGFLLSSGLFAIDISLLVISFVQLDKTKIILCIGLLLFIVVTYFTQYFIRIYDEYMMIYVFRGIGLLPQIIDFKNIEVVKQISKRKVSIYTKNKKVYHVYIFNSTKLMMYLKGKKLTIESVIL